MGTITILKKPDISLDASIFEPTATATWVEFVKTGEARAGHALSEDLESFLVFTLMRFVRRTDLFSVVLAIEFLKASTEYVGRKKEQALSEVGDVSLILAGLFPERTRRLGVSSSYFQEIGRLAFHELADSFATRRLGTYAELYRSVGEGFPLMTNVLLSAREEKAGWDNRDI